MSYNVETRKVQKTGGSSYIISLPKPWIIKHGIVKNDSIGIISQPDGNLLITPNVNSESNLKTKEILVEDYKDPEFLFRILIGAYIMGYSKTIVKSSRRFDSSFHDTIINFTKIAIGPEIIEESNNLVIMKDLLNPKEMPFEKTIRRMYILIERMHDDAINSLIKRNKELAEDVIKRDNDVDRLHWLISRQSNIILRDIILAQKLGITLEDASHFQAMSRFLERIADHAEKIARNALKIIEKEIDEEIIDKISHASKISLELFSRSLDAWLQKDMFIANENIKSINKLIEACENISFKNGTNLDFDAFIALSYIIESIRRTGEYSTDISELTINSIINRE
ncbi:MAG: PhoU domain-containing protein [Promethearchaeota archaeon]